MLMAKTESVSIINQFCLSIGKSRLRCGQDIIIKIGAAAAQRQNERPIGGTMSLTKRAVIELPDQAIAVSAISR